MKLARNPLAYNEKFGSAIILGNVFKSAYKRYFRGKIHFPTTGSEAIKGAFMSECQKFLLYRVGLPSNIPAKLMPGIRTRCF